MTVEAIVGLVAAGKTEDEILEAYTDIRRADVAQALTYAAWRAEEMEIALTA